MREMGNEAYRDKMSHAIVLDQLGQSNDFIEAIFRQQISQMRTLNHFCLF